VFKKIALILILISGALISAQVFSHAIDGDDDVFEFEYDYTATPLNESEHAALINSIKQTLFNENTIQFILPSNEIVKPKIPLEMTMLAKQSGKNLLTQSKDEECNCLNDCSCLDCQCANCPMAMSCSAMNVISSDFVQFTTQRLHISIITIGNSVYHNLLISFIYHPPIYA
jgi:hypothetical protein